jgi:hypothetical protein
MAFAGMMFPDLSSYGEPSNDSIAGYAVRVWMEEWLRIWAPAGAKLVVDPALDRYAYRWPSAMGGDSSPREQILLFLNFMARCILRYKHVLGVDYQGVPTLDDGSHQITEYLSPPTLLAFFREICPQKDTGELKDITRTLVQITASILDTSTVPASSRPPTPIQ